ncbi:MAG: hypothetical protein Q4E69_06720 [Bacilli bacterium]|nr:hypothetical protein [Bacilli bacterium]
MKIDVRSRELLEGKKKKYRLSHKFKVGLVTAALVLGIPGMMFLNSKNNRNETKDFGNPPPGIEEYEDVVLEDAVKGTVDEINNLNIIIDDGDCSDTFMEEVYNELENDGIKFKKSNKGNNINNDNSVVITLDQQYISGPGVLVIAPSNNNRNGNSDALALAMDTALYEKGFLTDGIECGIRGFREEDGKVVNRIPSKTEDSISKDKNTSFVTISFGTENINSELVVEAIENGLTRYNSYIQTNSKEDLIYRAMDDDDINKYAEMFNTTAERIRLTNKITGEVVPVDTTVKNPRVDLIRQFNKSVPVDLENVEKTKWAK